MFFSSWFQAILKTRPGREQVLRLHHLQDQLLGERAVGRQVPVELPDLYARRGPVGDGHDLLVADVHVERQHAQVPVAVQLVLRAVQFDEGARFDRSRRVREIPQRLIVPAADGRQRDERDSLLFLRVRDPPLACHPDLFLDDLHRGIDLRRLGVVVGLVVLPVRRIDEEVVRGVLVGAELEGLFLRAAGDRHLLDLPLLLGGEGRQGQRAGLELGLHAEQGLAAPDEGRWRGERHVPCFHALDDLVLVAGVLDLQLVLVLEGTARVPVGQDVQLVPDRAVHGHLDLLAEIRLVAALVQTGDGHLVRLRVAESGLDIHGPADRQPDLRSCRRC